ncbi:MAG: helix-turn-helix transcriptional regulator [Thermoanaerobaculia bacterium]
MNEKKLLRPKEVMEVIGLGRSKLYELMSAGELPVVRIGRAVRIPADAIDEWIGRQRSDAKKRGTR